MDLQENIQRIKEVMGIINEDVSSNIRRRLDKLPKYITSTYNWLKPNAFHNFEDFIERVVFSATRDFVADIDNMTYEEQLEIRSIVSPLIREKIESDFMDEIKAYYQQELSK